MPANRATLSLSSPDATSALARAIGPRLGCGDTVLLSGGIGAGKTHFARALIQSLLITPEDVPSPTYTLVQTYQGTSAEIWHADLYRLSYVSDIFELGLVDAISQAICLIEWPDRLGPLVPDSALWLEFEMQPADDQRTLDIRWSDPRWRRILKGLVND